MILSRAASRAGDDAAGGRADARGRRRRARRPRRSGSLLDGVRRCASGCSSCRRRRPIRCELETNAIDGGRGAGVDAHRQDLEHPDRRASTADCTATTGRSKRRLAAVDVASTVLQPSFFTLGDRPPARARSERGRFVMPTGAGRIAWIDPDDIAAVAAAVLAARRAAHRRRCASPGPTRSTAADVADPDLGSWPRDRAPPAAARRVARGRSALERHGSVARSTRPCISTRPSRAARWPTCPPTWSACSAVRRVQSTSWLRDELLPQLGERTERGATGRRSSVDVAPEHASSPGYCRPARVAGARERRPTLVAHRARQRRAPLRRRRRTSAHPSTKLPNVNGMSMPWHAPSARVPCRPA